MTNFSNLSHNRWPFLFHQKFPLLISDVKNVLTKHFPKMQPFASALQNRCCYKFPIFTRKYVLESLFNKVTGLIACNFIKKETPTQVFPCEYHKMFENSFFYGAPRWLFLRIVEEILRISKGGLTLNDLYDSTNLNV